MSSGCTYFDIEVMKHLSKRMDRERLFIREAIHRIASISVSTTIFTRKDAKKKKVPINHWAIPLNVVISGTKQIATDRRANLGSVVFEELTIMNSAWKPKLHDVAAWNSAQAEDVDLPDFEFEQMLVDDGDFDNWAKTFNWV